MKFIRTLFVVFAALFICASAVNAGSVTYETILPSKAVDWSSGWVSTPAGLVKYDGAEPLTSITFYLEGTVGPGGITLTNKGTDPATLSLNETLSIAVITPLAATPTVFAKKDYSFVTPTALNQGVSYSEAFLASTVTDLRTFTWGDADLSPFIGTGLVSGISIAGHGQTTGTGGGNASFDTSAMAAATLRVTYTYGVPEPATFVLLGAGLVVVTAIGRKRLAKR